MILPDTSAWIDYLRDQRTPAVEALQAAIEQDIAVLCEPVRAEIMRGARDRGHQDRLERFFAPFELVPTSFDDWENAATIGAITRRNGVTIRSFMDCLIAGIAIHHNATVLHSDVDYERIAEAFPLLDQTRG